MRCRYSPELTFAGISGALRERGLVVILCVHGQRMSRLFQVGQTPYSPRLLAGLGEDRKQELRLD